MHLVHALRGALDRRRVANVAGDEFDVFFDFVQPARTAPRELSSSTRTLWPAAHQRLHQRGADEACCRR